MIGPKFIALAAFVVCIGARPHSMPSLEGVSPHATHVAFDRADNTLIAFDVNGSKIGSYAVNATGAVSKRQSGSCALLSTSEVQSLPGWPSLDSYASANWGSDYDLHVNPSEHSDSPAIVCVGANGANIVLNGNPSCNTLAETSSGEFVGTSGSVALALTEGTLQSTTVTVTQSATIGVGVKVTASVSIPDLVDVGAEVSTSVQIQNSVATATQFQTSDQSTQTITLTAPQNQLCYLTFDATTCTATGTGSLPFIASGWVWFYYPNQRNGHYEWAALIEAIITDPNQRSSTMQFQTQSSSNTNAQFSGQCV